MGMSYLYAHIHTCPYNVYITSCLENFYTIIIVVGVVAVISEFFFELSFPQQMAFSLHFYRGYLGMVLAVKRGKRVSLQNIDDTFPRFLTMT